MEIISMKKMNDVSIDDIDSDSDNYDDDDLFDCDDEEIEKEIEKLEK